MQDAVASPCCTKHADGKHGRDIPAHMCHLPSESRCALARGACVEVVLQKRLQPPHGRQRRQPACSSWLCRQVAPQRPHQNLAEASGPGGVGVGSTAGHGIPCLARKAEGRAAGAAAGGHGQAPEGVRTELWQERLPVDAALQQQRRVLGPDRAAANLHVIEMGCGLQELL